MPRVGMTSDFRLSTLHKTLRAAAFPPLPTHPSPPQQQHNAAGRAGQDQGDLPGLPAAGGQGLVSSLNSSAGVCPSHRPCSADATRRPCSADGAGLLRHMLRAGTAQRRV